MLNRIRREGPGLTPPPSDPVSLLAAALESPPAANGPQPDRAKQPDNARQPDDAQPGNAFQPGNDADPLALLAAVAADAAIPPVVQTQAAAAEQLPGPDLAASPAALGYITGEDVQMAQLVGNELKERPEHKSPDIEDTTTEKRLSEGREARDTPLLVELEQPLRQQASEEEKAQQMAHAALPIELETQPPEQQFPEDLGTIPTVQTPLNDPARGQPSAEQAGMLVEEQAPVETQQGAEEDLDFVELSDDEPEQGAGDEEGLQQRGFPLDLEWLRDEDVEDARNYLMGIEGGQTLSELILRDVAFAWNVFVGREEYACILQGGELTHRVRVNARLNGDSDICHVRRARQEERCLHPAAGVGYEGLPGAHLRDVIAE